MTSESDMRRHSALPDTSIPQLSLPRFTESESPTSAIAATSIASTPPAPIPEPTTTPLEPTRSSSLDHATSQASTDDEDSISRPETPPIQDETPKHRRFSILRFRNASDSQLSLRAKQQAEKPPPMPRPPEIITTAPVLEIPVPQKKQSRMRLADRFRKSGEMPRASEENMTRAHTWKNRRTPGLEELAARSRPTLVTFEEPVSKTSSSRTLPTAEEGESQGLPVTLHRASESSRSDVSSAQTANPAETTPTKLSAPLPTNFFRLPRRKNKSAAPLFDLSHLPQKSKPINGDYAASSSSMLGVSQPGEGNSRPHNPSRPSSSYSANADSVVSWSAADVATKAAVSPATALFRPGSIHSGRSSPTRARLQLRGRSSTMSSLGRDSMDDFLNPGTTRTSSSTGRKSLGDLFGLNRLRQNSELASGRPGNLTPATPGSSTSKNNSLQIAREPVALPERREDETAAKYLARIEQLLSRGVIASALSRGTDPFFATVLRSYMRRFSFFGDPMDMAIRKLLMEAELPKETQQIDRWIYSSPDQAYFIAFSLLILHTDVFNKNNKYKMQQNDYIKNTRGEGVSESILRCFYDNITYTPFIYLEDDVDLHGDRQKGRRRTIFAGGTPDAAIKKSSKEPLDPYTLIIDGKLDVLRPSLKDVMELDDNYNYLGTAKSLNVRELQRTFFRTGVLQIVSARSRPDAFRDEKSTTNPDTAPQGVVDIKITKVGLLWRKDTKKKKTRSPWQEWGAILTGAQLYFFRNTAWVKSLMHQYDTHVKQGYYGEPITFKPQLTDFKPDAFMPIKEAVALVDSTYKKHKNAFKYARPGAFVEEVLLADNEDEMNDWLAKLNYAAAFMTSGVRMRGVVGGNYEGQSRRGIRRLDSSNNAQVVQTPTGEVSIVRGKIDLKEAESILAQRHETMARSVEKADEDISVKEKELEEDLRNARHLQILSPIQSKSREELLREAARMDVKIKWIRMEIWRIRCHRDVLSKDLEEEGLLADMSPAKSGSRGTEAQDVSLDMDKPLPPQPDDRDSLSLENGHIGSKAQQHQNSGSQPEEPDVDSPTTEYFQTPPTSATFQSHRHQRSWDSTLSASEEPLRRARSESQAAASSVPIQSGRGSTKPPSTPQGSRSQVTENSIDQHADDVDAGERDLLEQAGLLESPSSRHTLAGVRTGSISETGDLSEQRDTPGNAEKADRNKIRRSLQRTLRESAGHLSHHRSKKGKDSASSGISEDTIRDDILSRGSGSFVVHGKKASVINFGEGLQHMPTEERLRQKMQAQREEPVSPASLEEEEDYHDALGQQPTMKERRESTASASTATARSFRELHRKYSTAQAHKTPSHGGRRTPLPAIETQFGDEEEAEAGELQMDEDRSPLSGPTASRLVSPKSPAARSTASPLEEHAGESADSQQRQKLSGPHVQSVKA
ncbi:Arf guanine nucleotide exchange factor sec74 like protein [Verticillium longisporum]|nr:Arf guanine nucleotide exchange factor sec74 like protein [Verticillium longisporum]